MKQLEQVDVNTLTPIEAMNLLYQMKEAADREEKEQKETRG